MFEPLQHSIFLKSTGIASIFLKKAVQVNSSDLLTHTNARKVYRHRQ